MVDESTRQSVCDYLAGWEVRDGFSLLFAVESGSRAWGFPSPDSDYDVRFVYQRPTDWYLSVQKRRDVLEAMPSADLDFAGWDLQKALPLLRKSNPSLLEWLGSPIVYAANAEFMGEFRSLAERCVSLDACFRHYLHMAESNWRAYFSGDEVRVKKYLYVLRPLLAARWIEQARSLPPVLFDSLVAIVGDLGPLFDEIASLLALKAVTSEVGSGPRRPVLDAFAESEMRRLAELRLPSAPPIEFEELDAFFRRWLERSR